MAKAPRKLSFETKNADDNEPKKLSFEQSKEPKAVSFKEQLEEFDRGMQDAKRLAAIILQPKRLEFKQLSAEAQLAIATRKKLNEKTPKLAFDNASLPSTQKAIQFIADNYPEMLAYKDKLERQIRQLYPLSIEALLVWGTGAAEDSSAITVSIAEFSNKLVSANDNKLIEETIEFLTAKPGLFGKFFSKEINLDHNKNELNSLKRTLAQSLSSCETYSRDMNKIEERLKINHFALISVRDTASNIDDNIKSILINRCVFLQGTMQQVQFTKMKIDQITQLIVSQIQRIDQLLNVTIVAFQAAK